MDDAKLTPAQFRIVCRVSRRGVCNESIQNMAKGCRLAVKTTKTVLPFLVSAKVLSKEKRTGQTSIYKVNPADQWQINPSPKGTLGQKTPQVAKRPIPMAKAHPGHQAQKEPHKGNPTKGIQIRGLKSTYLNPIEKTNTTKSFIPQ